MNISVRPEVALGEFMLTGAGLTDPTKRPDERFVLYSIPAFDRGRPEFVRGYEIGSAKKNVEPDDVLLSRIVPHIRRSWIVGRHSEGKTLASGEWIVFRSKKIDPNYLRHFLISDVFHPQFMQTVAGVGGSLLRATPKYVAEIKIPLLPLDEQRRIAAILDKVDELRRKRIRALELVDGLAQSIFIELFGDPASNPKSFKISPFEPLLKTLPNFGSMIPPRSESGEWVSLRVANIQNWALTLKDTKYIDLPQAAVERHTLLDGDIILARAIASEEHLGKCVVVKPAGRKWAFDSHLMRIRLNTSIVDPVYVRELFRTPGGRQIFLQSTRKTTVQYNINTKELRALRIPVPPIELQREFVSRVEALERMRGLGESSTRRLDRLFSSLQHRAFSGQL